MRNHYDYDNYLILVKVAKSLFSFCVIGNNEIRANKTWKFVSEQRAKKRPVDTILSVRVTAATDIYR